MLVAGLDTGNIHNRACKGNATTAHPAAVAPRFPTQADAPDSMPSTCPGAAQHIQHAAATSSVAAVRLLQLKHACGTPAEPAARLRGAAAAPRAPGGSTSGRPQSASARGRLGDAGDMPRRGAQFPDAQMRPVSRSPLRRGNEHPTKGPPANSAAVHMPDFSPQTAHAESAAELTAIATCKLCGSACGGSQAAEPDVDGDEAAPHCRRCSRILEVVEPLNGTAAHLRVALRECGPDLDELALIKAVLRTVAGAAADVACAGNAATAGELGSGERDPHACSLHTNRAAVAERSCRGGSLGAGPSRSPAAMKKPKAEKSGGSGRTRKSAPAAMVTDGDVEGHSAQVKQEGQPDLVFCTICLVHTCPEAAVRANRHYCSRCKRILGRVRTATENACRVQHVRLALTKLGSGASDAAIEKCAMEALSGHAARADGDVRELIKRHAARCDRDAVEGDQKLGCGERTGGGVDGTRGSARVGREEVCAARNGEVGGDACAVCLTRERHKHGSRCRVCNRIRKRLTVPEGWCPLNAMRAAYAELGVDAPWEDVMRRAGELMHAGSEEGGCDGERGHAVVPGSRSHAVSRSDAGGVAGEPAEGLAGALQRPCRLCRREKRKGKSYCRSCKRMRLKIVEKGGTAADLRAAWKRLGGSASPADVLQEALLRCSSSRGAEAEVGEAAEEGGQPVRKACALCHGPERLPWSVYCRGCETMRERLRGRGSVACLRVALEEIGMDAGRDAILLLARKYFKEGLPAAVGGRRGGAGGAREADGESAGGAPGADEAELANAGVLSDSEGDGEDEEADRRDSEEEEEEAAAPPLPHAQEEEGDVEDGSGERDARVPADSAEGACAARSQPQDSDTKTRAAKSPGERGRGVTDMDAARRVCGNQKRVTGLDGAAADGDAQHACAAQGAADQGPALRARLTGIPRELVKQDVWRADLDQRTLQVLHKRILHVVEVCCVLRASCWH